MANEHDSTEVWKAVVGYEGLYEVSSQGRVRRATPSHTAHIGFIMKLQLRHRGYLSVSLSKHGVKHIYVVHGLVCAAFHGPKPVGPNVCARHLNDVKLDNRADNVSWGTLKDNKADAIRLGTIPQGERHSHAVFLQSQVDEIRGRYLQLLTSRRAQGYQHVPHGTIQAWAKEYGVSIPALSQVVYGYGYGGPKKRKR